MSQEQKGRGGGGRGLSGPINILRVVRSSSLLCHSALYNVVLGRSCRRSQGVRDRNLYREGERERDMCVCVSVSLSLTVFACCLFGQAD